MNKEIKYKTERDLCLTLCPYSKSNILHVGSVYCQDICVHNIKTDKELKTVVCNK